MKRIRFDTPARRELRDAYRFYEDRQSGLGKRWLQEVEAACQRIRQNPRTGRIAPHGMRRQAVADFPYHLVFENQDACIFVFAVMHLRREPDCWVKRLPPT